MDDAFEAAVAITGAARLAGGVAAAGFVLVAGFQAALALGAPWGRAAWGGAHRRLPGGLRIASAVAVILWLAAALVVLARAGYRSPIPSGVGRWATWVLFGLLVVGTLMNLVSRSKLERLIQTPTAAGLAILCLLVALGPVTP
ncbi:MAG: hypothetical protein ACRDH8_11635 [Actinomycetota bacterium]